MTIQAKSETKAMTCEQCEDEFKAPQYRYRALCPRCARANVLNSILQMRAKSGPYYDKWLQGMERHRKRKAEKQNANSPSSDS